MGKRDTYRDEIDWEEVDAAYRARDHELRMRELMTPERGIVVDECRYEKR